MYKMKRMLSAFIVCVMLIVAMNHTLIGATENVINVSDITSSFIFDNTQVRVNVTGYRNHKASEINGGGFVIKYDPDVVRIETMTEESWSSSWKELEPGILEFSHQDVVTKAEALLSYNYSTHIYFEVIGIGSPKFELLDSYCRTVAGEKISLTTEVIYDNDWKTIIPNCEYDEVANRLNVSGNGTVYNRLLPEGFWGAYADAKEISLTGSMYIDGNAFSEYRFLEKVTLDEGVSVAANTFPDINVALTMYGVPLSSAERVATEKGYIFVPTKDVTKGDIDQNNVLNAADALKVLEMAARKRGVPVYGYTADVVEDGVVNAKDALRILQKAANVNYLEVWYGETSKIPEEAINVESESNIIKIPSKDGRGMFLLKSVEDYEKFEKYLEDEEVQTVIENTFDEEFFADKVLIVVDTNKGSDDCTVSMNGVYKNESSLYISYSISQPELPSLGLTSHLIFITMDRAVAEDVDHLCSHVIWNVE